MTTTPSHYGLGELIDRLRAVPDQSRRLAMGFRNPHSYRGYYNQLAFEFAEGVTVAEMLAAAESALGTTYHGWKGGDYEMRQHTETWLVHAEGESDGETIGAVLLDLMLADSQTEAQASQRAMDGRAPVWQHSCGRIIPALDPGPNWCSNCQDATPWQPLYVLGEVAA